jgi:hypothetical protein
LLQRVLIVIAKGRSPAAAPVANIEQVREALVSQAFLTGQGVERFRAVTNDPRTEIALPLMVSARTPPLKEASD